MTRGDYYKGKVILVTGGAGSIGRELVGEILEFGPALVKVLDNNETALFELERQFSDGVVVPYVGDIRDQEKVKRTLEKVDIVFHAAALKHVALCELHPHDAVQTNVFGTENVINAALDEDIEKVMLISTDKAVNPASVMGATKLLAERLALSANFDKGDRRVRFSCVRFGNVLASRGSVVTIFQRQIERGGPVTITHSEMTRFVMSIPHAVDLILRATEMSNGGEIFLLKMQALRIVDLATAMIEELAPLYGYKPEQIGTEIIGKRLGEKMYEELMTDDEAQHAVADGELFVLNQRGDRLKNAQGNVKYTSHLATKLSKDEIKQLLRDYRL